MNPIGLASDGILLEFSMNSIGIQQKSNCNSIEIQQAFNLHSRSIQQEFNSDAIGLLQEFNRNSLGFQLEFNRDAIGIQSEFNRIQHSSHDTGHAPQQLFPPFPPTPASLMLSIRCVTWVFSNSFCHDLLRSFCVLHYSYDVGYPTHSIVLVTMCSFFLCPAFVA